MNRTIHFNHQVLCRTKKVRNETINYLLTAKLETSAFFAAKRGPQFFFRRGHVLTKSAGLINLTIANTLKLNDTG